MSRTKWNTSMVSEELAKENCTLISKYERGDKRITYTYEGQQFTVRWFDWIRTNRLSRPHLSGGNRSTKEHKKWNNERVNELLQQDDCELADVYRSTKQRFRYQFNNSYYWVTLDDWIHHQARPHLYYQPLEKQFREYLETNNSSHRKHLMTSKVERTIN